MTAKPNIDMETVAGFGDEWARFPQDQLGEDEKNAIYRDYFDIFPWQDLDAAAVGADIGCGSGRWASVVAPKVRHLHLVDASERALEVARRNLAHQDNVEFHHASVDALPFETSSLDFAYSLGVLHHVPDTQAALGTVGSKLKAGGIFLVYLYYALDGRPAWFRVLWQASDVVRKLVSKLPHGLRGFCARLLAIGVYWPLARFAWLAERPGMKVGNFPLAYYRDKSFYVMATDALDRFGTRLEQRFTRQQIERMLLDAGFERVRFSTRTPYWCAVAYRSAQEQR